MATHAQALDLHAYRSRPHTWQTQFWARAVRRTGRYWVMSRYVHRYCKPLSVEGRRHLADVTGPAIIIANHSSHFDTPLVLSVLPESLRSRTAVAAAADKFYRRGKRTWWFSLFWNAFPIERGGGSATLDYALRLLREGWSILIYPEGTRSIGGDVRAFRHGVSILAMQAGVPVVPIYSEGLRNVMPKGERLPRPASVGVRIGEPVLLGNVTAVTVATERLQEAMASLTSARGAEAVTQPDSTAMVPANVR